MRPVFGPISLIAGVEFHMAKNKKTLRAKFIVNTGAGAVVKQASLIEQVTKGLTDRGLDVDVALVHPIKHGERIARKAAGEGYDIVIGMGGDGTLGAVIRASWAPKRALGLSQPAPPRFRTEYRHSRGL